LPATSIPEVADTPHFPLAALLPAIRRTLDRRG
jgi:hypothetical protein